jgi:hypothetical protein
MSDNTQQRIDSLVKSSDILLFMKGSASFPMCGFSGRAIQILKACGVDPKSVVHPPAVRQGRIHRRLGHHDGDVRIRRAQAGAGHRRLNCLGTHPHKPPPGGFVVLLFCCFPAFCVGYGLPATEAPTKAPIGGFSDIDAGMLCA